MLLELIGTLAVCICAAPPPVTQDDGKASAVRFENATARPVEFWVNATLVATVPARSHGTLQIPAATWCNKAGEAALTGLSDRPEGFCVNTVVVSGVQDSLLTVTWGGLDAAADSASVELKAPERSAFGGLFEEYWQVGSELRAGRPATYRQSMLGREFGGHAIGAEVIAVKTDVNAVVSNRFRMLLRRLPAGSFTIAQAGGPKGRAVTLSRPFYVGVTEVTRAQWALGNGTPVPEKNPDVAVGDVTWGDADRFCSGLGAEGAWGYSLPTEAQWEYACQSGVLAPFNPGKKRASEIMWSASNSRDRAHEVATLAPNSYGLFDMHGNVREWCRDWWSPVPSVGTDPTGPASGSQRVRRGGSFDWPSDWCWCGHRDAGPPQMTWPAMGLRVVLVQP